jgi:hypothetical protein
LGTLTLQDTIDESIYRGTVLTLARISATDYTNDPSAKLQAWFGESTLCCAGAADAGTFNITTCKTQATQTSGCFGGGYTFKPDPTGTAQYLLSGKITAGALSFGAASFPVQIPLGAGGTMAFVLKGARVFGDLSGGKITKGVLVGGISQTDLDTIVLPTVAALMTSTYQTTTDMTTKAILKGFDTDGNGTITAAELKTNALIGTFLSPDVDVDSDGKKELSLGMGFTAVGASIDDTP